MKKVGILTFHRANNHGAVLQCYALQEVLKSIGYDTQIIDYRQPFVEEVFVPLRVDYFLDSIKRFNIRGIAGCICKFPKRYSISNKFNLFRSKFLNCTSPNSGDIPQDIDVYVIGSDQLWGIHCTGTLDEIYLGNFKRSKSSRLYGYAISTNEKSLGSIDGNRLNELSKNFNKLSFREKSIRDKVQEIISNECRVDIDPTLLAEKSVWDKVLNSKWSKRRYVLIYQVRKIDEYSSLLHEKAKIIAKELNCEVIDLSSAKYSPEDFVSLFKYAQYVITTSFHGTAFSLIFERPMYCIRLNDGYDSRYVDLLTVIEADEMLVDVTFKPMVKNIDYSLINSNISMLRQSSILYLKEL